MLTQGHMMEASLIDLQEIEKWEGLDCSATMLCAITGKTPDEIGKLLQAAAAANGLDIGPELLADYRPREWRRAIELLGAKLDLLGPPLGNDFNLWPSVASVMLAISPTQLHIVQCQTSDGRGHVFATLGGCVVDTYTDGRRVKFAGLPKDWPEFGVRAIYRVART